MHWLRYWGPAVLWAAAIWFFSTSAFSAEATSSVLLAVLRWLLPSASPETLQALHGLIRKAAHFLEFLILSMLLLRAVRADRSGWRLRWAVTAAGIAAGYAAVDEFHQSFVAERTASLLDVLVDVAGAAAGQMLLWLHFRPRERCTNNRQEGGT